MLESFHEPAIRFVSSKRIERWEVVAPRIGSKGSPWITGPFFFTVGPVDLRKRSGPSKESRCWKTGRYVDEVLASLASMKLIR